TELVPGERLKIRADASATVDRPNMDLVTAWRRGEIMFEDTSLLEAMAEFNRYSHTQVHVEDPRVASLRISGVFKTHDPETSLQIIAVLHHLRVVHVGDTLILKR